MSLVYDTDVTQIVPERFTSITEMRRDPIVFPELTSTTRTNDLDKCKYGYSTP